MNSNTDVWSKSDQDLTKASSCQEFASQELQEQAQALKARVDHAHNTDVTNRRTSRKIGIAKDPVLGCQARSRL